MAIAAVISLVARRVAHRSLAANDAGKSTLVRVLAGAQQPDFATMQIFFVVGGRDLAFRRRVNDLSKSAGDSGALRRDGYLRRAPHLSGAP